MAQRPDRAHLQNALLNWSPWSSNWSSGIKNPSGARDLSLCPSLPLPMDAASPCRGGGVRGLHAAGPGLWLWLQLLAVMNVAARRACPGVSEQVVTDICLQRRQRPPRPAASGRIVSGGSWERQDCFWSHTRCLEAWNTKGRSGGGHSCAP